MTEIMSHDSLLIITCNTTGIISFLVRRVMSFCEGPRGAVKKASSYYAMFDLFDRHLILTGLLISMLFMIKRDLGRRIS